MAVNSRFRTLAFALRDKVTDTYALLAVVDAVMALDTDLTQEAVREAVAKAERPVIKSPDGHATYEFFTDPGLSGGRWIHDHDWLVGVAMDHADVLFNVRNNNKIQAIKILKASVPGCSLVSAKRAVEDTRVGAAAALYSDPWDFSYQPDEPPF